MRHRDWERMRQLIQQWGTERGDYGAEVEELRLLMGKARSAYDLLNGAMCEIGGIMMRRELRKLPSPPITFKPPAAPQTPARPPSRPPATPSAHPSEQG
jgi:hypothetical protein